MPLRNSVSSVSIKFYKEEITQSFYAHNNLDLLLALHHPSLISKLRFQKGGDSKWEFQSRSMMKDKLSIHIPLQTLFYWPYNTHFPFHPIHITPSLLCFFALHRDIITQPHFYHCYITNFAVHISSLFLQTVVHLIHFFQTIVHLIYHSFPLPQSIAFTFTIFGYTHIITLSFNLVVTSTFHPISTLEINDLEVSFDKV